MKGQLNKVIGTSVIALSMAILPFTSSVSAQNTSDPTTTTTPGTTTTSTTTYEDNNFDWGWLGLLGLAGLAGLAGRRHEEPARYRDPNAVGSTGYRE